MIGSEFEVYGVCLGWARSQVKKEGGDMDDPAILREVLAPIIPNIRFLTMTSGQLTQGPIKSGILTESEGCKLLLKKFRHDLDIPIPEGLCCKESPRCFLDNSETFVEIKTSPDDLPTSETWSKYKFNGNVGGLQHNFNDLSILGVQLPTQVKRLASDSDTYKEDFTVLVYHPREKKVHSYRFTAEVPYDSLIDVPFKEGISVNKPTNLDFRVVFHTSGCYPYNYKKKGVPQGSTFGSHQGVYYRPTVTFIYQIALK